jgi:hypothetical protein
VDARKFDDIVANLAKVRVQERLEGFRSDLGVALRKLYENTPGLSLPKATREVFGMILDQSNILKSDIWATERKVVAESLLDTMDVVEQAMLARPDPDGPQEPESGNPDG